MDNIIISKKAAPLPLLSGEEVIFQVRPAFIVTLFLIIFILLLGGAIFILLDNIQAFSMLKNFINPLILKIIFSAVFFFVDIVIFLGWYNTTYTLTNKRVEIEFGIIGSGTSSIYLPNVQNVISKRGLFGMIFGFGDVITTSATFNREITFKQIANPIAKKEDIENAL